MEKQHPILKNKKSHAQKLQNVIWLEIARVDLRYHLERQLMMGY